MSVYLDNSVPPGRCIWVARGFWLHGLVLDNRDDYFCMWTGNLENSLVVCRGTGGGGMGCVSRVNLGRSRVDLGSRSREIASRSLCDRVVGEWRVRIES